jgi:S-DNA-T family DNA segregation ATPase FtsK/SpoIIIE
MARAPAATAAASRADAAGRALAAEEPVGLELVGVALCLGGLLLAAALATLAPEGAEGSLRNAVGPVGMSVAATLTRALGIGAWLLPAFLVAWGLPCLRGRRPAAWGRKAALLPVLLVLTAIEAALVVRSLKLPGIVRSGPGGWLGTVLALSVFRALGRASSIAILVGWLAVLRYLVDLPRIGARPSNDAADGDDEAQSAVAVLEEEEAGTAVAEEADGGEDEEQDDEEEEDDDEEDEEEEPEDESDEPRPAAARAAKPPKAAKYTAKPLPRVRPKPRPPKDDYVFPTVDLLERGVPTDGDSVREEVEANAVVLQQTLASFDVETRVVSHQRGPVITFYELEIASGVRLSRVTALADDLAIALKAPSIRIVAPIPGKNTVGIEVPNITRDPVVLRDLIETSGDQVERKNIPIFLGSDTAGRPIVEDLASMPHLLVAGATGSGKSVCINSILLSILFTKSPDEVNLILVDPKQVELSFFEGIPHLMTPVVTEMKRAAKILEWAVERMEERYGLLLQAGVRNIAGYNAVPAEKKKTLREQTGATEEDVPDHLSHVVIVVDELADLIITSGKEVEFAITRLAQKSRAVGIHMILATQRPSTNVITGLIKANMPTRISFRVSSKVDSRVVLDANGADKLLGHGDMLYMHPRSLHVRRAQGTLVTDAEARAVVDFVKEKCPPRVLEDILKPKTEGLGDPMLEDDLYDEAVRAVLETRLGSASMLQRRLGIGYTRASRLVDMMGDRALVGPHVGSKAREVLLTLEEWEAQRAAAPSSVPPLPSASHTVGDDEIVQDESWD